MLAEHFRLRSSWDQLRRDYESALKTAFFSSTCLRAGSRESFPSVTAEEPSTHHSGTYSASAETLGPDELLALAPNRFVDLGSCRLSTFYRLLIACMKTPPPVVSRSPGTSRRYYPTCSAYAWRRYTTHDYDGRAFLDGAAHPAVEAALKNAW